jgi:hypothetical protein
MSYVLTARKIPTRFESDPHGDAQDGGVAKSGKKWKRGIADWRSSSHAMGAHSNDKDQGQSDVGRVKC